MYRDFLRYPVAIQVQQGKGLILRSIRHIKYYSRISQSISSPCGCIASIQAVNPGQRQSDCDRRIAAIFYIVVAFTYPQSIPNLQILRQCPVGYGSCAQVVFPQHRRHPGIRSKMRLVGICQVIDLNIAIIRQSPVRPIPIIDS